MELEKNLKPGGTGVEVEVLALEDSFFVLLTTTVASGSPIFIYYSPAHNNVGLRLGALNGSFCCCCFFKFGRKSDLAIGLLMPSPSVFCVKGFVNLLF